MNINIISINKFEELQGKSIYCDQNALQYIWFGDGGCQFGNFYEMFHSRDMGDPFNMTWREGIV